MSEYRQYRHLTADPLMALAYARIADLHDAAARRRRSESGDRRIRGRGNWVITTRRLRHWWHRGPATPSGHNRGAKNTGAATRTDLPSSLKC